MAASPKLRGVTQAQRVTDAAFPKILELLRPGITERELAEQITACQLSLGADGIAPEFPPIAAFGSGTADVHHDPSAKRRLKPGDLVMLDYGCQVDGYRSDMTRMAVLGKPTAAQWQAYRLVHRAQLAAAQCVRAGLIAAEVDAVARDLITHAGHGPRFRHTLGHGIGRRVHQQPTLGPRGRRRLRAGDVVTIEPGVYFPGRFGIRQEDMVLVTARAARVLTRTPRRLFRI